MNGARPAPFSHPSFIFFSSSIATRFQAHQLSENARTGSPLDGMAVDMIDTTRNLLGRSPATPHRALSLVL